MKLFNYIYLITNKVNSKIYIGKHSTDKLNDGYMGSGLLIKKAILKYGIENFTKEYLAFCDTKEKLNYFERFYIRKYKANINGYNLSEGGDGGKTRGEGWRHSDETKNKISKANKGKFLGEKNGMYGKHHTSEALEKMHQPKSEEHKRKLSESTKRLIAEKGHPMLGKHMSDESKRKSSNAPGHRSEETRAKLREAWIRRKNKTQLL